MKKVKTADEWIKVQSMGIYEGCSGSREFYSFNGEMYCLCPEWLDSKEVKIIIEYENY